MLKYWSLRDFKSIGPAQELALSPLTVFAGANNSGKSSLLQSILIVAQTLKNTRDYPALVVDGELFKGGEPQELIHRAGKTLAFALETDVVLPQRTVESAVAYTLSVQSEFGISGGTEKRFAVRDVSLSLHDPEGALGSAIRVRRRARKWAGKRGRFVPPWLREDAFDFEVVGDAGISADTQGVLFSHFIPQYFVSRRDAPFEVFTEAVGVLLGGYRGAAQGVESLAIELAKVLFEDPSIATMEDIGPSQRNQLRRKPFEKVPPAAKAIFAEFLGDYRWRRRSLPTALESAIASLRALGNSVRYLGPLRLPPQYVYSQAPDVAEGSVGTSGEFTAAQLYRNRALQVDFVNPSTNEVVKAPLIVAVEEWLRHLGVLAGVATWYRPKMGHYLWVTAPDGPGYLDLTSVGVGVSQVLPVLVQSLLAPRGATLIFEQPELHLHPAVQSLLGDFFLGVARCGKQCLVETHSEHIVDRIRLRVAESDRDDILKLASVYFASRDDGVTTFSKVRINRYGSLIDWPPGFFDESHEEAERILSRSLEKRARERS